MSILDDPIVNRIDHASLLEGVERRCAFEEIIADLRDLICKDDSPEARYLLGYCWYMHPGRQNNKEIWEKVERELLLAVKQKPSLLKAWLYLCHNAYDFGYYELALSRLSNIDFKELVPHVQLIAQEMHLCCMIHLNGLSRSIVDIKQFVDLAEQHPVEDIFPYVLARTISQYIETIGTSELKQLKLIIQQLDKAGKFEKWFSKIIENKPTM